MDIKDIQAKLKELRDRIKSDGRITAQSEDDLKAILNDTLVSANTELTSMQDKLTARLSLQAGNDNELSEEQKKRLRIVEKTGTGSTLVH